jgi:hypothetical protein
MNRKNYIGLVLAILVSIALLSCTDDDGLLGSEDRDAFLGTWNVIDSCSKDAYSVNIIKDTTNSSQVIIENFWLIGFDQKAPYAIIAGTTISIPQQFICDNNSNKVSGSGKLDKKTITLNYTVDDGADLWSCKATYE